MTKRVVITGMGVVSSVGNDVPTFWRNLLDGYCGIDFVEDFFGNDLPVKIAGNVKNFNAEDFGMDKSFIRKQDKFTQFGMAAAYQAMNDSRKAKRRISIRSGSASTSDPGSAVSRFSSVKQPR